VVSFICPENLNPASLGFENLGSKNILAEAERKRTKIEARSAKENI